MKRLASGTRIGPPWPIAALNLLGPVLRKAGLFPKVADPRLFKNVEKQARRKDQASDWVKEARRVRFASFDDDAGLSLFGALAVRSQVRQCFKNTLEFDALIEAHPEITSEKITKPLFVLGWPRTGTTVVQRLLSLHRDARYTPVWEGYCPLPETGGKKVTIAERQRRARNAMALLNWVAPDMATIHPMAFDAPDECYHLFRNYSAMPPGWDFAYLPGYWRWFAGQSAVPAYELHKRQLQILQWLDRRGHWVLKSPQHLAGLPALMQVYPDARIVFTHRDPIEAIASYCSLVAVAWGMTSDEIDAKKVVEYVLSNARQSKKIADGALQTIPPAQIVHVGFKGLTADPLKTIASIYERFDYPPDADLTNKTRRWLVDNPHGRHTYNLADFGLTPGDIEAALAEA